MDKNEYNLDIDRLRSSIKLAQWTNVGLVIALLLISFYLIAVIGKERTVVVPGGLSKSFWLTDRTMSASGLEELAAWIAYLKLDISPESIDWKNEMTLKHTDPSQSELMKSAQLIEASKIKKEQLSSIFAVQGLIANEEKLAAVVSGRLATYVNGQPIGKDQKSYYLRFNMAGGKPQLLIFREVQHADLGKLILENPIK